MFQRSRLRRKRLTIGEWRRDAQRVLERRLGSTRLAKDVVKEIEAAISEYRKLHKDEFAAIGKAARRLHKRGRV